jgi:hypothetical protein
MRYLNHRSRIIKAGASGNGGGTTPNGGGTIQLTNKSGGVLEYGDVVIIDKNNSLSITTTNLYYNPDVIGVVKIGGGNNQLVTIQYAGIIDVKLTVFAANVGDNIYTGDVHGRGFAYATGLIGAFAKALTTKPHGVTGMIKVLLSGGIPEVF